MVQLLHRRSQPGVVRLRQPDAEAGPPIVVSGEVVIKAEALGPLARQAHRRPLQRLRQPRLERGQSRALPVSPGQCEAVHRAASARRRRRSSATALARSLFAPNRRV